HTLDPPSFPTRRSSDLTAAQTALTPEARLANVAGAFATRNAEGRTRNGRTGECSAFRVPSSAFERPLILVDDVFTTGATLAEARSEEHTSELQSHLNLV